MVPFSKIQHIPAGKYILTAIVFLFISFGHARSSYCNTGDLRNNKYFSVRVKTTQSPDISPDGTSIDKGRMPFRNTYRAGGHRDWINGKHVWIRGHRTLRHEIRSHRVKDHWKHRENIRIWISGCRM